jgi:tetratricopeptide (TPR) repeat protein
MKRLACLAVLLCLPFAAPAAERLGTVDFPSTCQSALHASINRGVALLHDFWYDEAERQFETIVKREPKCGIAYWGLAMSRFHQIWDRPDDAIMAKGRGDLDNALRHPPRSERERAYVAALGKFYRPENQSYEKRTAAYVRAMADLHRRFPDDVDAAAFYALALLAAEAPADTSLSAEKQAEAVLQPLFARFPDNPGVVHYLIHACDTPTLAAQGLAAAKHYGEIAPSGAHAVHMPGHIFARLGMWREDLDSNLAAVAASEAAQRQHRSEGFDELHANEFLLYAYLQSGEERKARQVIDDTEALLVRLSGMPHMAGHMGGMSSRYHSELPALYALELRDWHAAAALEEQAGARPSARLLTLWARGVAAGHLRDAAGAADALARYQAVLEEIRKGDRPYEADYTFVQVASEEVLGWAAHAAGDQDAAVRHLQAAADLQDRVGQAEVDIPAREMLADVLLENQEPAQALPEYRRALAISPNRFNGLFGAGMAAEQAGERAEAAKYYSRLLLSTEQGANSARVEFDHVKRFTATPAEDVATSAAADNR